MKLANNRIWIGGDQELFKEVQEEAFRLGYSWSEGSQEIIERNVSWMVFISTDFKGDMTTDMAYTPIEQHGAKGDFDHDTRGEKITLEDMKDIKTPTNE